jgi:hypothetical protein
MNTSFERTLGLPVSADEAMAWHGRPGAFARLAPPWQRLETVRRNTGLTDGSERVFRIRQGPISLRWRARHEPIEAGRGFADVQVAGPFAHWRHEHVFEDGTRETGPRMVDRITYRLPLAPVSSALAGWKLESDLDALFAWRHHATFEDLALHARLGLEPGRTVAITGASGLIGRTLSALLTTGGHRVIPIVRRPAGADDEVGWLGDRFDPPERLEGIDAFVDLAGENVAGGPWTRRRRRAIDESRGPRVEKVIEALGRLSTPPKTFLCASAIGIYGKTGPESPVDESAAVPGAPVPSTARGSFLADVVQRWESAALGAEELGSRVVMLRFGVVLSPRGGALSKMLLPFRAGLGAVPGSGRQAVSWVSADDAAAAVLHALAHETLAGPVNVVAPGPVSQKELCRTLARVLGRPLLARIPQPVVRLGLGEMGEETLLADTAVVPGVLESSGFVHRDGELEGLLRRILGKASSVEGWARSSGRVPAASLEEGRA